LCEPVIFTVGAFLAAFFLNPLELCAGVFTLLTPNRPEPIRKLQWYVCFDLASFIEEYIAKEIIPGYVH